jgi:F-box and leucine-rich repeat protein 14
MLQNLDLNLCKSVTDSGVAHLSSVTVQQQHYLPGCESVTDSSVAHLSSVTVLQHLFSS